MAPKAGKWAPWKAPAVTGTGSDLSGVSSLDLVGVTLVTEITGHTTEVEGLGLGFGQTGLVVRRPNGSDFVTIRWPSLVEVSAEAEPQRFGGLSTRVALEVQSDRRRHRFLVPNVTPEALTASLGAISGRYGRKELVTAPGRGRRRGG